MGMRKSPLLFGLVLRLPALISADAADLIALP